MKPASTGRSPDLKPGKSALKAKLAGQDPAADVLLQAGALTRPLLISA